MYDHELTRRTPRPDEAGRARPEASHDPGKALGTDGLLTVQQTAGNQAAAGLVGRRVAGERRGGGSGQDARAQFESGRDLSREGYATDARGFFERAAGAASSDQQPALRANIALTHIRAGNPGPALEIARQLEAEGHAAEAASIREVAGQRLNQLGRARYATGDYAGARTMFEQACEFAGPDQRAVLQANIAFTHVRAGEIERADQIAVDLDVTGRGDLAAQVQDMIGRLGEGGGTSGGPQRPGGGPGGADARSRTTFEAGRQLYRAGFAADARGYFERASTDAGPAQQPAIQAGIAATHISAGDPGPALAIARRLAEGGHDVAAADIRTRVARRLFQLGRAHYATGSFAEARRLFEEGLDLAEAEQRPAFQANIAFTLARTGNVERAEEIAVDLDVSGHPDLAAQVQNVISQATEHRPDRTGRA